MRYYYTDHENQVTGPIGDDELRQLFTAGTVLTDTNVCPEGGTDWRSYRAEFLPPPAPPLPSRSLVPVSLAPEVVRLEREAPQSAAAATQKCPFCAEDILAQAKKCKHCGETIDPVLALQKRRTGQTPNRMSI